MVSNFSGVWIRLLHEGSNRTSGWGTPHLRRQSGRGRLQSTTPPRDALEAVPLARDGFRHFKTTYLMIPLDRQAIIGQILIGSAYIRQNLIMADGEEEKGEQVRFTAPPQVWKYLGWLSRNTVLGKTEHEVARQLLVEKLAQMRQENYSDGQKQ